MNLYPSQSKLDRLKQAAIRAPDDAIDESVRYLEDARSGDLNANPLQPPQRWLNKSNCLRLFISHLAEHKSLASDLETCLQDYGICSFVAHEDIKPAQEWQDEIEKALRTCDILIALLHNEFNCSEWTDQEIGHAFGRGVSVLSVHLGMAPYGFLGKHQAFSGNDKTANQIAYELVEHIVKDANLCGKVADRIIERFCNSGSFAEATKNVKLVEDLNAWKPEYVDRLRAANKANRQIYQAHGVSKAVKRIIQRRQMDRP